ncbi:MAG: hypothetical protein ABIR54_07335 [Burkholderiaceae bacterium]|jgi:hypothetical protein
MREKTTAPPAARRPASSRDYGDDGLFQRLVRRVSDLLIMGVVGPVTGVLAIVAIHFATVLPPINPALDADAVRQREAVRVMAILEDRTEPGITGSVQREILPPVALPPPEAPRLSAADFGAVRPTTDARQMADWVVERRDNGHMPFIVLDKRDARLYVFEAGGRLLDQTPVLLGSAHGDETYPGIGDVPIAQVKPFQRTTAAGRFVTRPGLDADHTDVVWLDYDAGLAMHRVINKVKAEHRLQRIASANPKVRRISWGCINIPIAFFDSYVSPVFGKRAGVTYVIPERKSFAEVFEQGGDNTATVATASAEPLASRDVAQR